MEALGGPDVDDLFTTTGYRHPTVRPDEGDPIIDGYIRLLEASSNEPEARHQSALLSSPLLKMLCLDFNLDLNLCMV